MPEFDSLKTNTVSAEVRRVTQTLSIWAPSLRAKAKKINEKMKNIKEKLHLRFHFRCEWSFRLEDERDIASKFVHREANLIYISSSDKYQRNKFSFVSAQCR